MWGYVQQETREIDGNIVTHGPGYDDRLNRSETINVIQIFTTQDELTEFLKTHPKNVVDIYQMTPVQASLSLNLKAPVTRSGVHGTKI